MKAFALFILFVFNNSTVEAQVDSTFFIDELNASVNYSNGADENTKNKTGFGLGAYVQIYSDKTFRFLTGLDYTHLNQYKKRIRVMNHFGDYLKNVDAGINSIAVSVGTRIFPFKNNFFTECVFSLHLINNVRYTGTHVGHGQNGITETSQSFREGIIGIKCSGRLALGMNFKMFSLPFHLKSGYTMGFNSFETRENEYFKFRFGYLALGLNI